MKSSKVYFKGLNGLRFFAALLVLMYHAELIRSNSGLFHLSEFTLFTSGSTAVEFFFVLSGFLITYLLLAEQAATSTINIRQFYMRRVLRIWPLYYMVLIAGLLLVPMVLKFLNIEFESPYPLVAGGLLFGIFLPNLAVATWGFSFLGPLWSIGVEEQFYSFWAPLMKYFKKYAVAIFLVIIGLRLIYYLLAEQYKPSSDAMAITFGFLRTLKFEAMSIGGLGAWWLFHYKDKLLNWKVFSFGMQVFLLGLIFVRLTFHNSLIQDKSFAGYFYSVLFNNYYSFLLKDFLFLWLILNISCNPHSILKSENRVLNFLGNISYGIYMYHTIVILVVIKVLKDSISPMSPLLSTIILYAVAGGLTILVSYLSYRFVESKFQLFRKSFTPSSEEAAEKRVESTGFSSKESRMLAQPAS